MWLIRAAKRLFTGVSDDCGDEDITTAPQCPLPVAKRLTPARNVLGGHIEGPGLFTIQAVGESYRQDNIAEILARAGGNHSQTRVSHRTDARLESESDNVYDCHAIRVVIDSLPVGYLDRKLALYLSGFLHRHGFDGLSVSCHAMIVGGFVAEANGHLYGIKLDFRADLGLEQAASAETPTDITFSVADTPDELDANLCRIDNGVNFWSPPNMPSLINIYCRGGTGGEGKLGIVPKGCVEVIRRHIDAGGEVEARIASFDGKYWQVQCAFIAPEEVVRRHELHESERRQKLTKEISTPYKPVKPITITVTAPAGVFRRGEQLVIKSAPNVEDMVADYGRSGVLFVSAKTNAQLRFHSEFADIKRLSRLHHHNTQCLCQIVSVRKSTNNECLIKILITLMK
jgi:hypothetical protein